MVKRLRRGARELAASLGLGRWRRENGAITWNKSLSWGTFTPPEISATDYYSFKLLQEMLGGRRFEKALDLGCGYGRRTPWIAEIADKVVGVDPNPDVVKLARSHYPQFEFHVAGGQGIPLPPASVDLVVTWTVLQHIPPTAIGGVASEVQRVLRPGGVLLAYENTHGTSQGPSMWSRPQTEYNALFPDLLFVRAAERQGGNSREAEKRALVYRRQATSS